MPALYGNRRLTLQIQFANQNSTQTAQRTGHPSVWILEGWGTRAKQTRAGDGAETGMPPPRELKPSMKLLERL